MQVRVRTTLWVLPCAVRGARRHPMTEAGSCTCGNARKHEQADHAASHESAKVQHQPGKEEIREWLLARRRNPAPLPDLAQIRAQLGWGKS
jgi:hypothetical protein